MSDEYCPSSHLKRRFVKDYSLPITILKEPYFSYFINLYDPLFNSKKKYERLINYMSSVNFDEDFFFKESKRIISHATSSVKGSLDWSLFQNFDMSVFESSDEKRETIYQKKYHGFKLISIDLTAANFQCLRHFKPSLVTDCKSYEDFIGGFTDEEYFIKSKQIRQIIFGNLNPKRQRTIQKELIRCVIEIVKDDFIIIDHSADEVIIMMPQDLSLEEMGETIDDYIENPDNWKSINKFKSKLATDVRTKPFRLGQIEDKPFFKKVYSNGKLELKAVPGHYFAETYKHILGEPVNHMDMSTYYDGRIVTFAEPLF